MSGLREVLAAHRADVGWFNDDLWRNHACSCGWWSTTDSHSSFDAHDWWCTEPAADVRRSAHSLRETYVALRQEGFTEPEALTIVGQPLAISINNQGDDA